MERGMSFQERRSIVNLASSLLVYAFYSAYMIPRFPNGDSYSPEVFRFWGVFFLVFVPVIIVAKIALYILFYIVNTIVTREEEPSISDERDQLIELKATRYSRYVFGFGVLLAMGSLAIDMPPSTMFILLMGSGIVSEIVSETSQFYYYRRGV
jgi:hypothetical protein